MSDLINRADAIEMAVDVETPQGEYERAIYVDDLMALPSADAEPKWNCTASFVAEQLDRLRKMTDGEKWEFFKRFFEIKGGGDE